MVILNISNALVLIQALPATRQCCRQGSHDHPPPLHLHLASQAAVQQAATATAGHVAFGSRWRANVCADKACMQGFQIFH
ncbi:hypothetical protein COO60DRAFT_1543275 [Scenedesmus sp. NREL 46B-D3]|nr:hypothetical protein COO60DRAFT_1543275 [Scenedesmus sp. NREL 46B-D3]